MQSAQTQRLFKRMARRLEKGGYLEMEDFRMTITNVPEQGYIKVRKRD